MAGVSYALYRVSTVQPLIILYRVAAALAVQRYSHYFISVDLTAYVSKTKGQSKLWQVFSIGTIAAYSAKYSAIVAYKILELFQY